LERGVLDDDGIREYFEGSEGSAREGMFSVLALMREGRE
jgi:hypothetical protein